MDGLETFLTTTITAIIGSVGGWFIGKKKRKSEGVGLDIHNVSQALLIFQKDIVEPLREELKRTREELEEARGEIAILRVEIDNVHKENQELRERYQKHMNGES
jgi:chromosome segregation ATPase